MSLWNHSLSATAWAALLLALMAPVVGTSQPAAAETNPSIMVLPVKGAIGIGTQFFITEALDKAEEQRAPLVVIQLDTPGGLVAATREIISRMLASRVPVAVYAAPSGARAASAGTYMAYAAHIAAMAPGTHLGAATPVPMNLPGLPQSPGRDNERRTSPDDTANRKMVSDAVAYLRSLAQLRGRSTDWADKFVREAATLTANEALSAGVIDVVARDMGDLIRSLEGRSVKLANSERSLSLSGIATITLDPGWKVRFLSTITDPNIAFILLLIGIYGILFEFWSPGLAGSGIIGGISLIVALMALSALPLNYAGLALLVLGLILMIGEGIAPGFGILGIGGTIAFVLGAIFLFDPAGADIEIGVFWPLILAAALTSALLLIGALGMVVTSRRRPVITGHEQLIGLEAEVVSWQGYRGKVRVHGEIWSATGEAEFAPGAQVVVKSRDQLTLGVAALQPH